MALDTINVHRFAIIDKTGAVINCIMGPLDYQCPYGDTAVYDPTDTVETGWKTSDGGKTFTPAATSQADLLAALSLAQNNVLKQLWTFDVGATLSPLIVTTKLTAAGQTAMQQLLLWGQVNATTQATQTYCNDDYSLVTLTAMQAQFLGVKAVGVVSQTFQVLGDAVAKIKSGSISTLQEVASVTWPDSTVTR